VPFSEESIAAKSWDYLPILQSKAWCSWLNAEHSKKKWVRDSLAGVVLEVLHRVQESESALLIWER